MRNVKRVFVALLLFNVCQTGWSQSYPSRPVRVVVGFGAGGPDTTARLLSQQLSIQTGQSFIVDNRPGASGTIGADIVAKATPDGYTLLVGSATMVNNAAIAKKLPFDVVKDLAPVSQLAATEAYILVVNASLPAQNVKELIALARKPDSKISYGSNGVGSGGHLVAALFNARAKTNMVHVPYKGAGATTTALMAGEIQLMFGTPPLSLPLIKAGKVRALAYDNDTRASFLPAVPTLPEAGLAQTDLGSWHGMFAPARIPAATLARLESEVRKAIAQPEMHDRIEKLGLIPIGKSSAEFKLIVAKSLKASTEAARAATIEPE